MPYEKYSDLYFKVPIASMGDCFDRYLLRIAEMRQAIFLIYQVINILPKGSTMMHNSKVSSDSS
jgi:NADH-quinone oxidoreductase subunit D